MRLKDSFFYTYRENIKDEDSISGNLLTRAGMVKKTSSGVYMYLPLGYKVLNNIISIIRDEMNKTGAQEVLMPSLISEEIYISSGRRAGFGSDMFSLNDRFNKPYVLGPTHEELFLMAAKMKIKSYKDMPFNIYQFQTKFRDEPRPRYGLIRVREFIMKDAYSFDSDLDGLDKSYKKMFDAYCKSFDRIGLKYAVVKADTGVMGGLLSEEFQAITDIGEDVLVMCDKCDFSSNLEIAECVENKTIVESSKKLEKELIHTPNAKTIEEVSKFLNESPDKFVKSLVYKIDNKLILVLIKGDREINETKLRKLLNATSVELADFESVKKLTGANVGFAGPVGIDTTIVMDKNIQGLTNFIVGANKTDYHFKNVNITDFRADFIGDICQIRQGDICPKCGGNIYFKKGIEVGNTFKLGTKYSKSLGLEYLDNNGKLQSVVMGSYGIGPGRCMSAVVEQSNDEKGIIWPVSIAPYKVAIVLINSKDSIQNNIANDIYKKLNDNGFESILDDRDERAGVKFNDMDLIGIPFRIVVGKGVEREIVEVKSRIEKDNKEVRIDEVVGYIKELLKNSY
ncbi:MAG: proline--tRNA ligase [Bacilli bacterium]|nr:proline--tRNA ligase [Bacilli bacterium]